MYSKQELTNVTKAVFEQELEDGALDQNVSDAVDAYLVENPVDITALEGQDISCNSVDADAGITGAEIIEKMSGYSFEAGVESENLTKDYVYAGVVKNGNKLTFALAFELTRTDTISATYFNLGNFVVPNDVYSKLFPNTTINGLLQVARLDGFSTFSSSPIELRGYCYKNNSRIVFEIYETNANTKLVANTKYYVRYEVTFLLSDNLAE